MWRRTSDCGTRQLHVLPSISSTTDTPPPLVKANEPIHEGLKHTWRMKFASGFLLGGAALSSSLLVAESFSPRHKYSHRLNAATSDALPPQPPHAQKPSKGERNRAQLLKKSKSNRTHRFPLHLQGPEQEATDKISPSKDSSAAFTVDRTHQSDRRSLRTEYNVISGQDSKHYRSNSQLNPIRIHPNSIDRQRQGGRPSPTIRLHTPVVPTIPWRAPYQVSMNTQAMLKAAAAKMEGRPDYDKATAILLALLNTSPEQVNEANVVCALTLSAKCMSPKMQTSPELRSYLFRVLDILKIMVERGQLGARQLCNAIYAIAKHYNKDEAILPIPPISTAMSSNEMIGVAEAWILQDEDEDTPEHRLESTIEKIATSLTATLNSENEHGPRKPKVGEVSMACWAYGVLRQRVRPPGWVVPPQLSRLPSNRKPKSAMKNVQLVTFEQWAVNTDDSEPVIITNPVGLLFDSIGNYLCAEHEGNGITNILVHDMSWSEMANVAWAFANHGHCRTESSERLMAALAEEATTRLQMASQSVSRPFLPRDISQLVWSIGTLQSDNFRLGDDLARLIDATALHYLLGNTTARPLETWGNADLVQLAIALAHGRIDHLPLLRTLYQEASLRVPRDSVSSAIVAHSFHEWEVSVLLWVQARLFLKDEQGHEFKSFLQNSTRWLMQRAAGAAALEELGIGAQEQANLAWSLTVLEAYQSPGALDLLRAIFKETSTSGSKNEFIQLEHAHQLWQALYLMEYEFPEAVESVPLWFRDFLKEKWSVEKARQKISSARHRSLSKTLDMMGVAHFNEHDEDIDVAIVLKDNSSWTSAAKKTDHKNSHFKVAVEFDGPLHFTREKFDELGNKIAPRALGHTALKYRLLKRQGWAVVRVPYYEFDKIPFWASMERQRYLQRLLKTDANVRFSEVDVSEYKAIAPNRRTRFD